VVGDLIVAVVLVGAWTLSEDFVTLVMLSRGCSWEELGLLVSVFDEPFCDASQCGTVTSERTKVVSRQAESRRKTDIALQ